MKNEKSDEAETLSNWRSKHGTKHLCNRHTEGGTFSQPQKRHVGIACAMAVLESLARWGFYIADAMGVNSARMTAELGGLPLIFSSEVLREGISTFG